MEFSFSVNGREDSHCTFGPFRQRTALFQLLSQRRCEHVTHFIKRPLSRPVNRLRLLGTQSAHSGTCRFGRVRIGYKTARQHLHSSAEFRDDNSTWCLAQHFSRCHLQMIGDVLVQFAQPHAHSIISFLIGQRGGQISSDPLIDVRMSHQIIERCKVGRHVVASGCNVQS